MNKYGTQSTSQKIYSHHAQSWPCHFACHESPLVVHPENPLRVSYIKDNWKCYSNSVCRKNGIFGFGPAARRTLYKCFNPGVPFWTREKTHLVVRAITSIFDRNTRWRHGRSQGETKYSLDGHYQQFPTSRWPTTMASHHERRDGLSAMTESYQASNSGWYNSSLLFTAWAQVMLSPSRLASGKK